MEYLSHRGIPFTARNIREEPEALRELIEGGFTSTPIIRVDDVTLVGFEPEELEAALQEG